MLVTAESFRATKPILTGALECLRDAETLEHLAPPLD
jgi:hypothetical protein